MKAECMHRLLVSKMENQCLTVFLYCLNAVLHANCSFLHLCFSGYWKSGQTANQIPSLIESKTLQMYILKTLSISAVLPLLVPHQRSLPNCIITCCSQSRTFVIQQTMLYTLSYATSVPSTEIVPEQKSFSELASSRK